MRKGGSKVETTPSQKAELDALASLPEAQINTRDVPEQRDWAGSRRGAFFRPIKQQLTLRLDADVVDWFRSHASGDEGYQTGINKALRAHVARQGSERS